MKKFLFAAFALSAIVIHAAGNDRTKQFSDQAYVSVNNDTIPSDTTKKDTASFNQLSYAVRDTVPKDTTTKDTMSFAMAYNVRDTVPADTAKKDSVFQFALLK